MKDLAALVALHAELNRSLEAERVKAVGVGDQAAADRIEAKQRLNDQAYFVICWGQLESEIDEACRAAIRTRRAKPIWADRRGWDLYNPDERRLSGLAFEDRAALVLDKASGPGGAWARLMRHYALRNQIAHGGLRPYRIDVASVSADFYRIQGALTR